MAAVLSRNISDIKKITIFMNECRRMGLSVLGPDINESRIKFTVNKKGDIRFGLGAIKGLGESAASRIIEERETKGSYSDIYDLVERVDLQAVNKKSLEALAASGAFDSFTGITRGQYFSDDGKGNIFIENLVRYGHKVQEEHNASQQSLFGDTSSYEFNRPEVTSGEEWPKLYKLEKEKELIGIYLSAHPLDTYKFEIDHFCTHTLSQLADLNDLKGTDIIIAGLVKSHNQGYTKTNKPYGTVILEDYTDSYRLMLFNKDYLSFQNFFNQGFALLLKASIQPRMFGNNPEQLEVKVTDVAMLANVRDEMISSITLSIPLDFITAEVVKELKQLITAEPGRTKLKLVIRDSEDNIQLDMFSRNKRINISENFINYLLNHPEIEFKLN